MCGSICVYETVEMGSSLTAIFDSFLGGWDGLPGGCSFRRSLTSDPANLTNFCPMESYVGKGLQLFFNGLSSSVAREENKGS